ncbi:MAG: ERG2 family protein [Polyangiaceae bacterium]
MRYVFDPEVLHETAKLAVEGGGSLKDKVAIIRGRLNEIYPGQINLEDEWVFNIAGGAMGQMTVLHASVSEYVIVFGTPIGTEGFSGRFMADDYFMILEGEQWAFDEGAEKREIFRPGEMHHMPRGTARGYRMPDHCYALEYARGFIPAMLPFGLMDQLTSALDARTVVKTLRIYTKAAVGAMLSDGSSANAGSLRSRMRGWLPG